MMMTMRMRMRRRMVLCKRLALRMVALKFMCAKMRRRCGGGGGSSGRGSIVLNISRDWSLQLVRTGELKFLRHPGLEHSLRRPRACMVFHFIVLVLVLVRHIDGTTPSYVDTRFKS